MVVTLVALAVALPGSAIAASGGSDASDGTVQACIAQQDTVHRVTDGVDQATGDLTAPISEGVNAVVGGIDQATDGAVSDITESVAPAESVLIVAPGDQCPDGYTPETLSTATSQVDSGSSVAPVTLAKTKEDIAETDVTTAGPYLVTATANISEAKASSVAQTVKCALVGANGQTIPGSGANGTIPIETSGSQVTVSISDFLPQLPEGPLSLDCKDPALAATTSARAAHIAGFGKPVSSEQCHVFGGYAHGGKCVGGPLNGDPIAPPAPPAPPKATGSIEATSSQPAGMSSYECDVIFHGKVANGRCIAAGNLDVGQVRS